MNKTLEEYKKAVITALNANRIPKYIIKRLDLDIDYFKDKIKKVEEQKRKRLKEIDKLKTK